MNLRTWQKIKVRYKANNQWKIYNLIIKKVQISRYLRFDEGCAYDFRLNANNKKEGEIWSPDNNEQLAFEEKNNKMWFWERQRK